MWLVNKLFPCSIEVLKHNFAPHVSEVAIIRYENIYNDNAIMPIYNNYEDAVKDFPNETIIEIKK